MNVNVKLKDQMFLQVWRNTEDIRWGKFCIIYKLYNRSSDLIEKKNQKKIFLASHENKSKLIG